MRAWTRGRRLLALLLSVVFIVGVLASPAAAARKGGSFSGSRSYSSYKSSGSRSFSSPKKSEPSAPSRSFSSPGPGSTGSSRSATEPSHSSSSSSGKGYSSTGSGGYSDSTSSGYSTPTSPYYSSGDRSFSSQDRSFSSQRPTSPSSGPAGGPTVTEMPSSSGSSYDPSQTQYPDMPPVIVTSPSPYGGSYWHDYYYGQPLYWRMFHRPVYHGSGFLFNWVALVGALVAVWILLGFLSAMKSKRRRRR